MRTGHSRKVARGRRRKFFAEVVFAAVLALVFGVSVIYISRLPALSISQTEIRGAVTSNEAVEKITAASLQEKVFTFLPRRNIFLFSKSGLMENLLQDVKELESVVVEREGKSIIITAIERTPAYLWCGETKRPSDDERCQFLDSKGVVFGDAPFYSGTVFIKMYGKLEGERKDRFLDKVDWDKITSFVAEIRNADLNPTMLISRLDSEYELVLGDDTKLLFNGSQDLDRALRNLKIVFLDGKANIKKSKTALGLEYVDLRFNNKVFFKERSLE